MIQISYISNLANLRGSSAFLTPSTKIVRSSLGFGKDRICTLSMMTRGNDSFPHSGTLVGLIHLFGDYTGGIPRKCGVRCLTAKKSRTISVARPECESSLVIFSGCVNLGPSSWLLSSVRHASLSAKDRGANFTQIRCNSSDSDSERSSVGEYNPTGPNLPLGVRNQALLMQRSLLSERNTIGDIVEELTSPVEETREDLERLRSNPVFAHLNNQLLPSIRQFIGETRQQVPELDQGVAAELTIASTRVQQHIINLQDRLPYTKIVLLERVDPINREICSFYELYNQLFGLDSPEEPESSDPEDTDSTDTDSSDMGNMENDD